MHALRIHLRVLRTASAVQSQVNAYQLLILGRKLDGPSIKYLRLGAGKPSAQLAVEIPLIDCSHFLKLGFQVSVNRIVPQQVSPTLGQRLLCMVAHAPTVCPKMCDNPSFVDKEWQYQRAALVTAQQEALEAARETGEISVELRMKEAGMKLVALQTSLRSSVKSAHDDERTTKQIRKVRVSCARRS